MKISGIYLLEGHTCCSYPADYRGHIYKKNEYSLFTVPPFKPFYILSDSYQIHLLQEIYMYSIQIFSAPVGQPCRYRWVGNISKYQRVKNFTSVTRWITFRLNPHAVRLNPVHMRFTPHEVTLNRTSKNETSISIDPNSIVLILTSMYFGFLDAYLHSNFTFNQLPVADPGFCSGGHQLPKWVC